MFAVVSALIVVFLVSTKSTRTSSLAFNEILGFASFNVPAYSNGNDTFISNENHFIDGVFMGMKWQCVEFARRWTFIRKGSIFESVDGAEDIWTKIKSIERLSDKKQIPVKHHPNGSPSPPTNESYLIYSRQKDMPFGHIAVIVDVQQDRLRLAEQNYLFHRWQFNYSREIVWKRQDGRYFVDDEYRIIGWIELTDQQTSINEKQLFSVGSRRSWPNLFFVAFSCLFLFGQH